MNTLKVHEEEKILAVDLIAQAIGFKSTCELCARFGGRTLYIPTMPSSNHVLSLILGHPTALKLGKAVGSTEVELPTLKEVDKKRRIDIVCRKVSAGESDRNILLTTDITRKELGYIKKAYKALIQAYVDINDRQMSFIRPGKPRKKG